MNILGNRNDLSIAKSELDRRVGCCFPTTVGCCFPAVLAVEIVGEEFWRIRLWWNCETGIG